MASPVRFKMQLKGHREAMAKYAALDRKMRRTIATKAVRAGAKIMVKALRAAAPSPGRYGTGAAKKALGTKIKTYRNTNITVAITGERMGARRTAKGKAAAGFPPAHLHLSEYGTIERFRTGEAATKKSGSLVGAFGEFRQKDIRAAQAFARIRAGGRLSTSKYIQKNADRMRRSRAVRILSAIAAGRSTGKVPPRPFFVKAFKAAVPAVQAAQLAVLKRELESAARAA